MSSQNWWTWRDRDNDAIRLIIEGYLILDGCISKILDGWISAIGLDLNIAYFICYLYILLSSLFTKSSCIILGNWELTRLYICYVKKWLIYYGINIAKRYKPREGWYNYYTF